MCFFLYLISGEKTIGKIPDEKDSSTGYVIRVLMGFWIFSLILGVFVFFLSLDEAVDGWQVNLITMFIMFVFSGLFEELAFRAVLNDAIIYQLRSNKRVFLISAIVTSLAFGAAHVIGSEITNLTALGTAVMKTISTGVIGVAFLFLYWKTRNIWAIGLVHGIYDFFASFSVAFSGNILETNYVSSNTESGMGMIILYAIFICIELLITWGIWRKVKKSIDFEEMRETW